MKALSPLNQYKEKVFDLIDKIKKDSGLRLKYIFKRPSEWKWREGQEKTAMPISTLQDIETLRKEPELLNALDGARHFSIKGIHRLGRSISEFVGNSTGISSKKRAETQILTSKSLSRMGETIESLREAESAYQTDPNIHNKYYYATRLEETKVPQNRNQALTLLREIASTDPKTLADNDRVAIIRAKLALANRLDENTGKRGDGNREGHATTALRIAEKLPDSIKVKPTLLAQAYEAYGATLLEKKDRNKAKEYFQKGLNVKDAFKDESSFLLKARLYKHLGMASVLSNKKNLHEGYQAYKQAWECYQQIPPGYDQDNTEKIWILYALGDTSPDRTEALNALRGARDLAKQKNDEKNLWRICQRLGDRAEQKEHAARINDYKEASKILKKMANKVDPREAQELVWMAIQMAKHSNNLQQYDKSRQYLNEVASYANTPFSKMKLNLSYANTYADDELEDQIKYKELAHKAAQDLPLVTDQQKYCEEIEPTLASNYISYADLLNGTQARKFYAAVANELPYAREGQKNRARKSLNRIDNAKRKK